MDNLGNSENNTCKKTIVKAIGIHDQMNLGGGLTHSSFRTAITRKFLTYQLWMAMYCIAMVVTGDRELGFDSGEGA